MEISVTLTGDQELRDKLQRIGSALNNFRNPMKEIGKNAAKYYADEAFASQGGVYGGEAVWAALSRSYALRKAIGNKTGVNKGKGAYPGRGILIRTGDMQKGFVATTTATQVVITNKVKYYKYHQSSELPRTQLPRRQMAGINDPIRNMIITIIRNDVIKKLQAA